MTHNFCESCNRVRLTCTGTLYMCLGQEDAADLRAPLRASEGNELVAAAIDEAIGAQAEGPRLHHRPPHQPPRRRPPHERHRRLGSHEHPGLRHRRLEELRQDDAHRTAGRRVHPPRAAARHRQACPSRLRHRQGRHRQFPPPAGGGPRGGDRLRAALGADARARRRDRADARRHRGAPVAGRSRAGRRNTSAVRIPRSRSAGWARARRRRWRPAIRRSWRSPPTMRSRPTCRSSGSTMSPRSPTSSPRNAACPTAGPDLRSAPVATRDGRPRLLFTSEKVGYRPKGMAGQAA